MINTKKIFLFIVLLYAFCAKSFADFTISPKISTDFTKDGLNLGVGITMGMGFHRGRAFFIDAIAGYQNGVYTVTTNFDWHILPWNSGIAQMYLGLGAGAQIPFDPKGSFLNPLKLTISGRIPIGIKFFFGTVELFFEASPLLSWVYTSYAFSHFPSEQKADSHEFGWGIQAGAGLRVWW